MATRETIWERIKLGPTWMGRSLWRESPDAADMLRHTNAPVRATFCRPRRHAVALFRIFGLVLVASFASALPSFAQSGYLTRIPNSIDPSSGEVVVIDTAKDAVRTTIPIGENPINLAVTTDRTKVYVASYLSDQVYVIDAARNSIAAKFGLGFGTSHYLRRQMAVSPDGQKIYELNEYPGNVSVVDVASNTAPTTIKVGDAVDLALTSNGAKLFVVNMHGNSVSVIDASSNTVTATIPVGDWPDHLLISPDDSTLFVAYFGADRLVSMIDTRTNSVVAKIELGGWFCSPCVSEGMAITPDGRKLYVTVPESRFVSVIDVTNRREATTIKVGPQKLEDNSMAITSDGRTLYVSPGSGAISAIDTASDAVVTTLPADGVLSLSPDGKKLYAVGSAVSVIDTASNKVIASIPVSGFGKMVFANTPSP